MSKLTLEDRMDTPTVPYTKIIGAHLADALRWRDADELPAENEWILFVTTYADAEPVRGRFTTKYGFEEQFGREEIYYEPSEISKWRPIIPEIDTP